MGFSISWCAVREEGADQFLRELGLRPTGETEEFPEAPITVGKLNTGWCVVWYNKYRCPYLNSQELGRLSTSRDVLLCLVEEHVMASSSELWVRGKQLWWLSHEGENGPKGLTVEGNAPDTLPKIRTEMEELQISKGGEHADVDYIFEIPLRVAQSIVGFKHDEDCSHLIGGVFHVMSQGRPTPGLLSRFLGR